MCGWFGCGVAALRVDDDGQRRAANAAARRLPKFPAPCRDPDIATVGSPAGQPIRESGQHGTQEVRFVTVVVAPKPGAFADLAGGPLDGLAKDGIHVATIDSGRQ